MIVTRACNNCQEDYRAESRYLKRGQGLFCSQSCSSKFFRAEEVSKKLPNVTCSFCNNNFYKAPSKIKQSKSGLFFCSRSHKDAAQRLGGIEEIMPNHYGTGKIPEYRKKSFANLPNECAVCGWNEHPQVLEVNHKNLNRSDNSLENLELLCPTHHQVFHYLTKTGRYARCK